MKRSQQIYLLFIAAALFLGIFLFPSGDDGPAEFDTVGTAIEAGAEYHYLGPLLFEPGPLDLATLKTTFSPFWESQPDSSFWERERRNPQMQDHYANTNDFVYTEALQDNVQEMLDRFYQLTGAPQASQVYFYISGIDLADPVIFTPPYLFIGLDNFIGTDYPGYQGIPEYSKALMTPKQLPVKLGETLGKSLVPAPTGDTPLLDQMVYWGKIYNVVHALNSNASPAEVLGYTEEQWAYLTQNEKDIWQHFVANKLLFNTDFILAQRTIEPAPFTKLNTGFDHEIPPRLGRFLGYRIVRAYLNNNTTTNIPALMAESNSRTLLNKSNYKP